MPEGLTTPPPVCALTLSRPPPRVGAAPKGGAALGRTGPRRSVTRTLREAEKPSSNFPKQESGFPSQRTSASSFLSFLSGLRAAAPWQAQEPASCGAEPGQGPLVTQLVRGRWPSGVGKVECSREGPQTTPRRPAPGRRDPSVPVPGAQRAVWVPDLPLPPRGPSKPKPEWSSSRLPPHLQEESESLPDIWLLECPSASPCPGPWPCYPILTVCPRGAPTLH